MHYIFNQKDNTKFKEVACYVFQLNYGGNPKVTVCFVSILCSLKINVPVSTQIIGCYWYIYTQLKKRNSEN